VDHLKSLELSKKVSVGNKIVISFTQDLNVDFACSKYNASKNMPEPFLATVMPTEYAK
jgi:hypothetical protein